MDANLDTAARLRRWADSRDRRNPFGHGKTGTALLRESADRIAELEEALYLALTCVERHTDWCGYKPDAPGASIINTAPRVARKALGLDDHPGQEVPR